MSSLIVFGKKKEDSYRFYIDIEKVNEIRRCIGMGIPIHYMLDMLHQAKYISSIDL